MKALKPDPRPERPIRTVQVTRTLALQCPAGSAGVFDWMVCDTIANGTRRGTRRRGPSGGPVFRFERTLPAAFGVPGVFAVLGEVRADACLALCLAPPRRIRKKLG